MNKLPIYTALKKVLFHAALALPPCFVGPTHADSVRIDVSAEFPGTHLESLEEVLRKNARKDILDFPEVKLPPSEPEPRYSSEEPMIVMQLPDEEKVQADAVDGQASDAFAVNVFRDLVAERPGNIVFSPASLEKVLDILKLGARGETLQALEAQPTGRKGLPGNMASMNVESADALFVADDLKLKPVAVSELRRVSFINGSAAASQVNEWCRERTHGAIPAIAGPDTFDALTRLVAVNAVYLKERWLNPFKKSETDPNGWFFLAGGGHATVPMMKQTERFLYAEGTDWQAVALFYEARKPNNLRPYKERGCFIGILPKGDARRFAATLTPEKYGAIRTALEQNGWKQVCVQLPKMKEESVALPLKEVLCKQGLGCLFTEDADLSGFTDEPLHVGTVLQSCQLSVDEEKTEASAVTVTGCWGLGIEPEKEETRYIIFNRPFIWAIDDLTTGSAPYFMGLYEQP